MHRPRAPEDAVLGTFHVAVREGLAYASPPSAEVALVPAGRWPIPGRRLGRSTSGSKGPELPGVRRLRGPPRPPLPGLQSRAWTREPEAPPAPGRPAQPGRRPAPAPSPGEQRPHARSAPLSLDPGPAIDRPCRCPPPLPPRSPAAPSTGLPVLPVPSSASPPHSSSLPAPSPARATSQPLSGPTSPPIPSLPKPSGSGPLRGWLLSKRPSFSADSVGPHFLPLPIQTHAPAVRFEAFSLSCFLPPPLRLASPHPHPHKVRPLPSDSPNPPPGPSSRPPSSHTVSDPP